jgi:hypothetical protein
MSHRVSIGKPNLDVTGRKRPIAAGYFWSRRSFNNYSVSSEVRHDTESTREHMNDIAAVAATDLCSPCKQSAEITSLVSQTLINFPAPCPQRKSLYKTLLVFIHAFIYCGLTVPARPYFIYKAYF